ncbi:FAD-binding oxidoreductase [Actinophytocola sp. NPDC049390]|uniref:FAD-binding oxidoreductase n=1 Tax=Actinophytocola sp. NPDC049390 TaxID=3363894 RepID=UPI0037B8F0C5
MNVLLCRSVPDVVRAITHAAATGEHLVPRGGGHCFANRSTTDGTALDMSGLDTISVADDGVATIGAGALLAQVYEALHTHGRTLPAGCGPTVGVAGLTLGGGIGLLGREHGLTCDRLVGAEVVLADGSVVTCDDEREPDLFWALRGAGGGQFGVVTSLRFDTVPEPLTTRVEAVLTDVDVAELVTAWQSWAPDAPDEVTVNLTLESGNARLFGATTLGEHPTRELLRELTPAAVDLRPGLPYHRLKHTFADPREADPTRMRSEFFSRPLSDRTLAELLAPLAHPGRQLTFTAMGGAYNRVAEDATAFAHRGERFLLEHIAAPADDWLDRSWATAHSEGSGRVYPNFPDPALDDWATAYHAGNHARLTTVKKSYDPDRFFDFPQAI